MAATKTKTKKQVSKNKRWVAEVKTDSTHPEPGLFTRKAPEIASALASKKVSPKGPASEMRMLRTLSIGAGRGLGKTRRAELEKAKNLLSQRVRRGKKGKAA